MNQTLKNIIKQTGVSFQRMRDAQEEEYMLTYDSTLRVCVGFNHDREAVYYNSCSWSCDAVCYVVITENMTFMYSPQLKEVDTYETAFIMDRIEDFFEYMKRFKLKEYQRVSNYLCGLFCQLDSVILTKDDDLYLKALSSFWGENDARVGELAGDTFAMFRDGFFIGSNAIVPDLQLIRKFVAHQVLDVISAVFAANAEPVSTLQRLASMSYRGVASNFISDCVIRFLLQRNLKVQKGVDAVRITLPYLNGCSLPLQCVWLLREASFDGRIILTTHSPLDLPETYYTIVRNLMDDEKVEWEALHEVGIDADYPKDQDYIITMPPYRIYDRLLERTHERNRDEFLDFSVVEELPFYIMEQVEGALKENGSLQMIVPVASLNANEFKSLRDKISEKYDVVSVESMGTQVYSLGLGAMCFVRFRKHTEGVSPQTVEIRWCDKTAESLDHSIRECIKRRNGGMNDNPELTFYRYPYNSFTSADWSSAPYSVNSLKTSISSKIENPLVPVSNLFNIMSGVRSGFNKAFVIPFGFYVQLPPEERKFFAPSASRLNICNGQLMGEMYVFYPYGDGMECLSSERDFSNKLPFFYDYIVRYKNYLQSKSKDTKRRWWDLGYRKAWHNPGTPKLISPSYGEIGSFVYDNEGCYVVSGGYQWMAKKKSLMSDSISYAYLSILTSDVFWKLIEIYSEPVDTVTKQKSYKLSKNMVESIPIPDLSKPVYAEKVERLCEYGILISHGRMDEVRGALNQIVNDIYGYIPE